MRKRTVYSTLFLGFLAVAISCHAECRAGGEGVAEGEGGEEALEPGAPDAPDAPGAPDTPGEEGAEPGGEVEPAGGGEEGGTPAQIAQARPAHDPVQCAGQEEITIENATITVPDGVAIRASGQCQVDVTNVTIDAKVAIHATGQAEVTIRNSRITGSEKAVRAAGQAKVNATGSTVTGGVETTNQAEVTGIQ